MRNVARSPIKKDINVLHAKLGHPPEVITHATGQAIGCHLTGMFNSFDHCALGKAIRAASVRWQYSKILGQRLFFNISSPLTPTLGDKKHWLLIVEDNINYAWSYFQKEKSELKDAMLGLIKNLKANIVYRSGMQGMIMSVKMFIRKTLMNKKRWELNLSIPLYTLLDKISVLNGNSLSSLIGYMSCSMGENFLPF